MDRRNAAAGELRAACRSRCGTAAPDDRAAGHNVRCYRHGLAENVLVGVVAELNIDTAIHYVHLADELALGIGG